MADQKITQLTALTTPTTDDLLAIVDDPAGTPVTKKITLANLLTLFLGNVVVQMFTGASGTYTPTSGMKKCLAIAVGSGGNGASVTGTDQCGGGGGGGGTCIRLLTASDIGASKNYVVGQANSGNPTQLDTDGALLNAVGGATGTASADSATLGTQGAGGAGGSASNGDLNITGEGGGIGTIYDTTNGTGGAGGRSVFGTGGAQSGTSAAGNNGAGYGGGGSGAHCNDGTDRSGGQGAAGVLYIIEFLD